MKSSIYQFLFGLVLVSMLFSCNKNSDNNNNAQPQVNQTSNGYVWNGVACIQTSTGQQVSTSYCANNSLSNNGSVLSIVCNGSYLLNGQIYQCGYTSNCSGFLMTNYQTGQIVQCL